MSWKHSCLTLLFLFSGLARAAAVATATDPCANRAVASDPLPAQVASSLSGINKLAPKCLSYAESKLLEARRLYDETFPETEVSNHSLVGISLTGTKTESAFAKRLLGLKPPLSWETKAAKCRTIRCALAAIYGNEEAALRAMVIARRHGYAVTVSQHENVVGPDAIFSIEQVREIQNLLEILPASFSGLSHLQQIVAISPETRQFIRERWKKEGKDDVAFGGLMDSAAKTLTIPLLDSNKSMFGFRFVLAHEMGHAYDASRASSSYTSFRDDSGFSALSQWKAVSNVGKVTYHKDANAQFCREYSTTDPGEDFADSVSCYVAVSVIDRKLGTRVFKDVAPQKYQWMKEHVFEGREFTPYVDSTPIEVEQRLTDVDQGNLVVACLRTMRALSQSEIDRCEREVFEGWVAERVISAEYCANGGSLRDRFRSSIAPKLDGFRKLVEELSRDSSHPAWRACFAVSDLRASCPLGKELSRTTIQVGLRPTDWQSGRIAEELRRLAAPAFEKTISKEARARMDRPQVFLSCLLSQAFINSKGDPKGAALASSPACQDAAVSRLRQSRIKMDSDASVVTEGLFDDLSRSFEEQVLRNFPDVLESCPDRVCRKTLLHRDLEDWVNRLGLTMQDLPPKFEDQLLDRIKVQ